MTGDEVTVGELVRRLEETGRRFENRLDEVVRRLEQSSKNSAERESRFEQLFLPRREFELSQQVDATQARGLESEVHKITKRMDVTEDRRRGDRILVFTALVAPVLVALMTAAILAWSI